MRRGLFGDIGEGLCYLAVAAAIIATYREPLRDTLRDLRGWWRINHPSGRMFREVREAANRPPIDE